jgi:hypothetical protein
MPGRALCGARLKYQRKPGKSSPRLNALIISRSYRQLYISPPNRKRWRGELFALLAQVASQLEDASAIVSTTNSKRIIGNR